MKKLFTFIFALVAFLALTGSAKSQTMYFCESVDNSGYAVGESSTFNIGSGGGYLYILTRLPYDLNSRTVSYDIYKVVGGRQQYYDTQYQDTERDWRWFYLKYTFYDSGTYDIYAKDGSGYTLSSGTIRINYK